MEYTDRDHLLGECIMSDIDDTNVFGTDDKLCEDYDVDNKAVFRYKLSRSVYLVIVWIIFGLAGSIQGTTLPDLVDRLDTTYEVVGLASSVAVLISMFTSFIVGYLNDRFSDYVDISIFSGLFFGGITLIMRPLFTDLWVFYITNTIMFLSLAWINSTGDCITMRTWGEQANSPIHAQHFGYGIGLFIGPFLCRPFLSVTSDDKNETTNMTLDPGLHNSSGHFLDGSQIEIPYAIVGCVFLAACPIALLYFFKSPPYGFKWHIKKTSSFKEVLKVTGAGLSKPFLISMLISIALFYFLNAGRESALNMYLFSYAVESDLGFTKQEAALLDGAYNGAFMLGRGATILLSHLIPIQPLLITEIATVAVFSVGLAFLGTQSKTMLYIFACLLSFVSAPIWPGGIAWMDKYVPITGLVLSVMAVGGGLSGFFFSWFFGSVLTDGDPDGIMYACMVVAALVLGLIILMQIVGSAHGTRFGREQEISQVDISWEKEDNNTYL